MHLFQRLNYQQCRSIPADIQDFNLWILSNHIFTNLICIFNFSKTSYCLNIYIFVLFWNNFFCCLISGTRTIKDRSMYDKSGFHVFSFTVLPHHSADINSIFNLINRHTANITIFFHILRDITQEYKLWHLCQFTELFFCFFIISRNCNYSIRFL